VKQARLIDRAYCPVRLVCNSFRFGYNGGLFDLFSDFDGKRLRFDYMGRMYMDLQGK